MTKTVVFSLVFFLYSSALWAQSYGTAMGLRFGNQSEYRTLGLTLQQRLEKGLTLEGIIQSDFNHNTTLHGLIKKHHRLVSKRFNYYYGTGISAGTEISIKENPDTREIIPTYGNATVGVDLILGVELTLLKANISLDYKPNLNLMGRNPWYSGQIGISARSVLVKGSAQNKKKRKRNRAKKKKNKEKGAFFKGIIRDVKEAF